MKSRTVEAGMQFPKLEIDRLYPTCHVCGDYREGREVSAASALRPRKSQLGGCVGRITRYTPESSLRHPIDLGRRMVRDLIGSRELAWRLLVRDISALYRQTLAGYFWALFPPLVASATFIVLNASGIVNVEGLEVPYALYVLLGTILWQVFVESILEPLRAVTDSKPILARIDFPKEALVLSGLGKVIFGFAIKLALFIVALLFFSVRVEWTILFLPIPALGLMLLGSVFGILLIPVALLYRDIQQVILIATSGLIFVTPVAYPPTMGGVFERIVMANPVTPYLLAARELAFIGFPPTLTPVFLVFGISLVLLVFAWVVYRCALPIVVERFGA